MLFILFSYISISRVYHEFLGGQMDQRRSWDTVSLKTSLVCKMCVAKNFKNRTVHPFFQSVINIWSLILFDVYVLFFILPED